MKLLSRDFYEMACDLAGFGPYAEEQTSYHTEVGIENRLTTLHGGVRAILDQLKAAREEYIATELSAAGITPNSGNLKIHVGSSSDHLKGWINVGTYPAPFSLNVLWGLPFKDACAERIFVSRIPELLLFPVDVRGFLFEVHRILARGGTLQMALSRDHATTTDDRRSFETTYKKWTEDLEYRTRLDYLLDTFHEHSIGRSSRKPREPTCQVDALIHLLNEEGFTDIKLIAHADFDCATQVDEVSSNKDVTCRRYSQYIQARRTQC